MDSSLMLTFSKYLFTISFNYHRSFDNVVSVSHDVWQLVFLTCCIMMIFLYCLANKKLILLFFLAKCLPAEKIQLILVISDRL